MSRVQTISCSELTSWVGNLARCRSQVVPDSQPTSWVGNYNGGRRDFLPDFKGSTSPPTSQMQASWGWEDVVLGSRGSGSGSQKNQSSTFWTTRSNYQPSCLRPSPGPNKSSILAWPPKRPRRLTIQTMVYVKSQTEPDRQEHLETVDLSGDSSDGY